MVAAKRTGVEQKSVWPSVMLSRCRVGGESPSTLDVLFVWTRELAGVLLGIKPGPWSRGDNQSRLLFIVAGRESEFVRTKTNKLFMSETTLPTCCRHASLSCQQVRLINLEFTEAGLKSGSQQ